MAGWKHFVIVYFFQSGFKWSNFLLSGKAEAGWEINRRRDEITKISSEFIQKQWFMNLLFKLCRFIPQTIKEWNTREPEHLINRRFVRWKKKPLNAVLFLTHFSGNHRNRNTVFFPRLLRKIILYFIFFIINKNQNSYETCETLQIDDVMLCPKIRSILWTKYDTFGILPEKIYRLLLLEWFAIDSFEFIGHIYDPSVVSFQCPFWEGHLTFAEQLYKDIYFVNQFAFVTVN